MKKSNKQSQKETDKISDEELDEHEESLKTMAANIKRLSRISFC